MLWQASCGRCCFNIWDPTHPTSHDASVPLAPQAGQCIYLSQGRLKYPMVAGQPSHSHMVHMYLCDPFEYNGEFSYRGLLVVYG